MNRLVIAYTHVTNFAYMTWNYGDNRAMTELSFLYGPDFTDWLVENIPEAQVGYPTEWNSGDHVFVPLFLLSEDPEVLVLTKLIWGERILEQTHVFASLSCDPMTFTELLLTPVAGYTR